VAMAKKSRSGRTAGRPKRVTAVQKSTELRVEDQEAVAKSLIEKLGLHEEFTSIRGDGEADVESESL
jgi:hypothetical protein